MSRERYIVGSRDNEKREIAVRFVQARSAIYLSFFRDRFAIPRAASGPPWSPRCWQTSRASPGVGLRSRPRIAKQSRKRRATAGDACVNLTAPCVFFAPGRLFPSIKLAEATMLSHSSSFAGKLSLRSFLSLERKRVLLYSPGSSRHRMRASSAGVSRQPFSSQSRKIATMPVLTYS